MINYSFEKPRKDEVFADETVFYMGVDKSPVIVLEGKYQKDMLIVKHLDSGKKEMIRFEWIYKIVEEEE